ncbi:MAG: hypothetical protein IIX19_01850 [Alistipes sp.]|nr:hypothetical protein [Alistipes sp.]
MSENNNTWLCRNCNTLVSADANICPKCNAERPEECDSTESNKVVVMENYANKDAEKKKKYIFREAVLVNAADILLILGIFLSIGALLSPNFIEYNFVNSTLLSIVATVVIFVISLITWALFRTLAEISRMLRTRNEKE